MARLKFDRRRRPTNYVPLLLVIIVVIVAVITIHRLTFVAQAISATFRVHRPWHIPRAPAHPSLIESSRLWPPASWNLAN